MRLQAITYGEAEFPVKETDMRILVLRKAQTIPRTEIESQDNRMKVIRQTERTVHAELTGDKIRIGVVDVTHETEIDTGTGIQLQALGKVKMVQQVRVDGEIILRVSTLCQLVSFEIDTHRCGSQTYCKISLDSQILRKPILVAQTIDTTDDNTDLMALRHAADCSCYQRYCKK